MKHKVNDIDITKTIHLSHFYCTSVAILTILVVFSFNSGDTILQQAANATASPSAGNTMPSLFSTNNVSTNNNENQQQLTLQTNPTNSSSLLPTNMSENLMMASFGNDRVTGTPGNDIMIGLLGSDSIRGEDGDDKIQGGEESDQLYGGNGLDVLQGGVGSDQLYGNLGNDVITGGMDDDYLAGEQGNDKLYGSTGDDILLGGEGADYFDCGEGVDVVIDFNLAEGDDTAGNCEEVTAP